MKKVIDINLGGQKFTIDEDAYKELDSYLNTINKHFSTSSGFEDIIYDIEVRIAELLEEGGTQIVTLNKVKEIQKIMGTPEDFGADPMDEQDTQNIRRRFFRDPDDKILGGVISGFAAYVGFKNLALARFIVFIMFLSGIGIIPYIILWYIIPEALTASDRLAMKGEDININSIAKAVEDGVTEIKDTVEDLSKNLKQKFS